MEGVKRKYVNILEEAKEVDSSLKRAKLDDASTLTTTFKSEVLALSTKQKYILAKVCQGESVFFTGAGGSGKSFLLKTIVQLNRPKTYVTSSTGISAVPLGGTTIHSFAGIGLGKDSVFQLVSSILRSKESTRRWREVKTLIIDEISMLDGTLFDKLEQIARQIRRRPNEPFGGIQLVVCGDFLQLPPVSDSNDFCFKTKAWSLCIPTSNQIQLDTIFRQQHDNQFSEILQRIRVGKATHDDIVRINERVIRPPPVVVDGVEIGILKMYSKRDPVAKENSRQLELLQSDPIYYKSIDTGLSQYTPMLDKYCQAPTELTTKLGSEVMLLRNWDQTRQLVNGSRGKIIGFEYMKELSPGEKIMNQQNLKGQKTQRLQKKSDPSSKVSKDILKSKKWPMVQFENGQKLLITPVRWEIKQDGRLIASRTQVPLMLASAITIHKTQGMTLDRAQCSLKGVFEYGQAYVALSRLRSLDCFYLTDPVDASNFKAHPAAVQYYEMLSQQNQFENK